MWRIEFTPKAEKQFGKLDKTSQQPIVDYLERVQKSGNPKNFGKALVENHTGFWRYRVGKYRLICTILEQQLVIEVVLLGKRDHIYG